MNKLQKQIPNTRASNCKGTWIVTLNNIKSRSLRLFSTDQNSLEAFLSWISSFDSCTRTTNSLLDKFEILLGNDSIHFLCSIDDCLDGNGIENFAWQKDILWFLYYACLLWSDSFGWPYHCRNSVWWLTACEKLICYWLLQETLDHHSLFDSRHKKSDDWNYVSNDCELFRGKRSWQHQTKCLDCCLLWWLISNWKEFIPHLV